MRDARQSAEDLKKKAEDLKQKDLADRAGKAAEDIRKAEKARSENRPAQADRHLDDALKNLASPNQQKDPKQDRKNPENNGKKKPQDNGKKTQKKSGKDGKGDPLQPQPKQGENPPEKSPPDPAEAARLLDELAKQEKDLRKVLKEQSGRKRYQVEKDW